MTIEKVDKQRACYQDYSLNEGMLRVGDMLLDLQAEQAEQEVIITFCRCGAMVHRGMMPCCEYVAEVIIPPRRYETIEVADSPGGDQAEQEMHTENVAVALDLDTVVLKLWPIEAEQEKESEGVM
jgi:hypothetical protein